MDYENMKRGLDEIVSIRGLIASPFFFLGLVFLLLAQICDWVIGYLLDL